MANDPVFQATRINQWSPSLDLGSLVTFNNVLSKVVQCQKNPGWARLLDCRDNKLPAINVETAFAGCDFVSLLTRLAAAWTVLANGQVHKEVGTLCMSTLQSQFRGATARYPYARALLHLGKIHPAWTEAWEEHASDIVRS